MPEQLDATITGPKILHFTYALQGGGAERQLRNLVTAMDPQRFTHAICCADPAGRELFPKEVQMFMVPRRSKFDQRWSSVQRVIRQWQPDIVHNWLPVVLWSSLVPARVQRIPYVGGYRSVYHVDSVKRFLQAIGFLFVDRIVSNVHEEEQAAPFRQIFRMKSGHLIPNGVDLHNIQATEAVALDQLGVDASAPTILYVGRLVALKNIPRLLEAIAWLQARSIVCNLLLCGEGDDEPHLRQLAASLGIDRHVKFLGYRTDVYGIMRSCDVFVLPSLWEGMPNVLFEAMAANLPVVASDIPVHRRWITDGIEGLLFDRGNTVDLAYRLKQVFEEPDAARQARLQNAQRCVDSLSIEAMVTAYANFYTNLVA